MLGQEQRSRKGVAPWGDRQGRKGIAQGYQRDEGQKDRQGSPGHCCTFMCPGAQQEEDISSRMTQGGVADLRNRRIEGRIGCRMRRQGADGEQRHQWSGIRGCQQAGSL